MEGGIYYRTDLIMKIINNYVVSRRSRGFTFTIDLNNRNKLHNNINLNDMFRNVYVLLLTGYLISIIVIMLEKYF